MTFALNKSFLAACILAFSSSMVVSADEGDCMSIADLACNTESLTTLCTLISVSETTYNFLSTEIMTVFAPTDDAFAALDPALLDSLGNCVPALNNVLSYHATLAELYSTDLVCGAEVPMANGVDSRTVCRDGQIYQKGALNPRETMPLVITADIMACNGVIHVLDGVMLPKLNTIPFGDCEIASTSEVVVEVTGTTAPVEVVVEVTGTTAPVEDAVEVTGTAAPIEDVAAPIIDAVEVMGPVEFEAAPDEEDASSSEDVVGSVGNVVQFTGTAVPDEDDASSSEDVVGPVGNVVQFTGTAGPDEEDAGPDEEDASSSEDVVASVGNVVQFTGTAVPDEDDASSSEDVVGPVGNVVQFTGTAGPGEVDASASDASSSEDAVDVMAPVENVVQFTGTAAPVEEDASSSEDSSSEDSSANHATLSLVSVAVAVAVGSLLAY